jgi:alkylhydroperoxidase/carboxymuconolactone decarboxylase family protein YurZ
MDGRLPDPSGHRDVALGLCRHAGHTLLVLNARSSLGAATRFWDLPGGSVTSGESVRSAIAREWEEEVGWKPDVGDLLFVSDGGKRARAGDLPLYTWRAFVFEIAAPSADTPFTAGPGIERIELVPEASLRARLDAPYHAALLAWLEGGPRYHEVSWIEAPPPDGDGLPASVRRLCVLAAAAATGDAELVATETKAAMDDGVPRELLEETLLQVVPYAGFPRAIAALVAARPVLGPPASVDEAPPESFPSAGVAAFDGVYGESAERVRTALGSLHPLLPAWTTEFAYGRVLARENLPLLVRELVAVAILGALGRADDALLGHARGALRLGTSRDAVLGAVAVLPPSAGDGRRAAARAVVARA